MREVTIPKQFVKQKAAKKLKVGRRYRKGRTYVTRHRTGSLSVVRVGRSLRADRRKKVSSSRIPKTRTGRPKRGYGHRGDYPRKRR